MRILLVYPKFAEAMWAYKHALAYLGKASSSPPLGLLTVAAMLPDHWQKRLVDLNVSPLTDADILAADLVFISSMLAQLSSTNDVIRRCKELGIPTVAGGPLFSFLVDEVAVLEPDHRFVGEAELSIPLFLRHLSEGSPLSVYQNQEFPDMKHAPLPLWQLVDDFGPYTMVNLQFTRGCPYDCEFCAVVALNGHKPRMKSSAQIIQELDNLYSCGWRGHVFVCDDNLIGNRKAVREEVLPAISQWMKAHGHPFAFSAAVSIDLAHHPDIMDLMVDAGFDRVTIGIESPNIESLKETNKLHNTRCDMLSAVHTIQGRGIEVQAGFIVGFDHDTVDIFREQIDFVQASGIATAMVSLLFAFPGTRLYARLQQQERLLPVTVQEHAYGAINFRPAMGIEKLRQGHLLVLESIYSPELYSQRVINFLEHYEIAARPKNAVPLSQLGLLVRVIWDLGIVDGGRSYFWKMIGHGAKRNLLSLPMIIRLLVTGYHFRKDIHSYRTARPTTTETSIR